MPRHGLESGDTRARSIPHTTSHGKKEVATAPGLQLHFVFGLDDFVDQTILDSLQGTIGLH